MWLNVIFWEASSALQVALGRRPADVMYQRISHEKVKRQNRKIKMEYTTRVMFTTNI